MANTYDFCGWATRFNRKCSDGRTITEHAFDSCDGIIVPLVWNHDHENPDRVLGHALLKKRGEGIYTYGSFNDTEGGQIAKVLVDHGDVQGLSIYANGLKQQGGNVMHGQIREVSLVLAGANPGAYIEEVLAHSDEETEGVFENREDGLELYHADDLKTEDKEPPKEKKEAETMADDKKEKTVEDVFNEFTEEQKTVVYALIGQALEDAKNESGGNKSDNKSDDKGDDKSMKHNIFDGDESRTDFLSHSDMEEIFADAKRCGSLREAVANKLDGRTLVHSIDTTGMETATGHQAYGFNDASMLFPDYKSLNTPPEFISRNMSWVGKVLGGVHHTPFSRIKSMFANITEDEARARGYLKAHQKKSEVFTTLKRTTDPQTVYKLQKMDRDDILDITDFDVVAWIRREMRFMLDEELARAYLIGDGRDPSSDDKIQPLHIRPIATDVPLFNTKVDVTVTHQQTETDGEVAKAAIKATLRARKNYKGSGNPTLFTTEDYLTEMLLVEDQIGHRLYKTEAELATALRVKEIVTVEPMEGVTVDNKPLMGVIVNLADYNVGADKGGEVNMFDDFDIDLNRQKYLIETRCSGALVKPYSALTLLLNVQD